MYKIDLHTHSSASIDGGIRPAQFRQALSKGLLDVIAITDHNRIDLAQQLHQELGDVIIVGEEITTTAGEVIGLFLQNAIQAGLTPIETVQAIKAQGGLVYIPHPFETVRQGLTQGTLSQIADQVDIIEVHNGRAVLQNRGPQAAAWAKLHHTVRAASSDAHGARGLGHTFTEVKTLPTHQNFLETLGAGYLRTARPPLTTLLYPKLNRLKKRLHPA
jgi:predicted metal-dependent phosphoesterase TrpH